MRNPASIDSPFVRIPNPRFHGDNVEAVFGSGSNARLRWDTSDANANHLMLQLPDGDSTDVPVFAIGEGIVGNDLGLFNGVVDVTFALFNVGAVTTPSTIRGYKTRGSAASPTVITSGDDLLRISAYGYSGAGGYVEAARIEFDSEGTIATTRVPGSIRFSTGTDAAPTVLTTALLIDSAQNFTLGGGITFSGAETITTSMCQCHYKVHTLNITSRERT